MCEFNSNTDLPVSEPESRNSRATGTLQRVLGEGTEKAQENASIRKSTRIAAILEEKNRNGIMYIMIN